MFSSVNELNFGLDDVRGSMDTKIAWCGYLYSTTRPGPLSIIVRPIAGESSQMTPRPYNPCEGASFTARPQNHQVARLLASIRGATPQSLGPSREQAAIPEPAASSRLRRQCHRRAP